MNIFNLVPIMLIATGVLGIIFIVLGSLFVASCGPKRLGCGPYRRCEVKMPIPANSEINKTQVS